MDAKTPALARSASAESIGMGEAGGPEGRLTSVTRKLTVEPAAVVQGVGDTRPADPDVSIYGEDLRVEPADAGGAGDTSRGACEPVYEADVTPSGAHVKIPLPCREEGEEGALAQEGGVRIGQGARVCICLCIYI